MVRNAAVDSLLACTRQQAATGPSPETLTTLPPAEGTKGMSFEQKKVLNKSGGKKRSK
jgi:hypothetical protein